MVRPLELLDGIGKDLSMSLTLAALDSLVARLLRTEMLFGTAVLILNVAGELSGEERWGSIALAVTVFAGRSAVKALGHSDDPSRDDHAIQV